MLSEVQIRVHPDTIASIASIASQEQLGTLAGAVAISASTMMLSPSIPWAEFTSKSGVLRLQLLRTSVFLALNLALIGLTNLLLPANIDTWFRTWLLLILCALTALSASWTNRYVAALAPIAIVIIMSLAGLVPWQFNFVFNLDTAPFQAPLAALLTALAVVDSRLRLSRQYF
ncbi:hypothetical protein CJ186_04220 [Actinomyces graevenitzii]|uniref:hypothetical protein n=1 Tax=Actinomyces graevenitzii TaxID=55565 RepID=UPI000C805A78|nr:hypothetical protein [Actinomyces graevenitzii]PMC91775.1 hypothetical protein CJ186_04220 [Actinomyces graevenitzii]